MNAGAFHLVVPGSLNQRTGGYIYDRRICNTLREQGWQIDVHELRGRFPGPDPEAEAAFDSILRQLPDRARVVIDGLALGGLPAPAIAQQQRLALIGLVHHPLSEETALDPCRRKELRQLEQQALAACRQVIVTSPFTGRLLRDWLPASIPIDVVIPGHRRITDDPMRIHGERPLLLCVGALTPRKGQDLLLEALDRLRACDWECVLAGSTERDPAFAKGVQAMIAERGLADRVRLLGECSSEALERLYRSGSLFVLPSWYEGYGMAFTEAMAFGLPILSTTGGAIAETVPANAGLLVPPGDVDALTLALTRLLEQPELRERLAQGAQDHAKTLPDWEHAAAGFGAAVERRANP